MQLDRPVRTVSAPVAMAVLGAVVLGAAVAGIFAHATSADTPAPPAAAPVSSAVAPSLSSSRAPDGVQRRPSAAETARVGVADGDVPHGVGVFATTYPGIINLDPDLLAALQAAATAAESDDVGFLVNSGWRSVRYQKLLLSEAIAKYGSRRVAKRWVASPRTSAHVSGEAVDLGPRDATEWLSDYGAQYGLCPTYANEPWHFELRPEAPRDGCPSPYPDAAHDPSAS